MLPPSPPASPFLIVIGGHSRSVGKTSLVCDLLRALPQFPWTAVKITQFGHGICTAHGEPCSCATDDHTIALTEDLDRTGLTDTSRFLCAGAARSLWLRTRQGRLAEALPLLRSTLANSSHAILESNSLLQFLRPHFYLLVLDPAQPDFKDSALAALHRADAFLLRSPLPPPNSSPWPRVPPTLLHSRPSFLQPLGTPLPPALPSLIFRHTSLPVSNPFEPQGHLYS